VDLLDESYPGWRAFAESIPDGIVVVDRSGVIRGINHHLARLVGREEADLVGRHLSLLLAADVRARHDQHLADFFAHPFTRPLGRDLDLRLQRATGEALAVDIAVSPFAVGGETWGIATVRDVSFERDAQSAHREMEQRFQLAFENSMSPIIFTDLDDNIVAANDAFCDMVGFSREELIGGDSRLFTYPEDVGITEDSHRQMLEGRAENMRYVKRYLHKDGRVIVVEVSRSPARDEHGNILYYVISERDITEERALTNQLSHQALHDPLTGLANRALIEDRLNQARSRVARQGGLGAVMILDLDDFKGVNDTHGHLVGDQLLVEVARRLENVSRTSDTLCRFGGDEFLYLAEGLHNPSEAETVATRLLAALNEPFSIAGATIEQHASIGVVIWDDESPDRDQVVEEADVALYEAKRHGKGRHVLFSPTMYQRAVSRLSHLHELREALAAGQLSMHYQPIVDTTSTEVVGFEALMRWSHPVRGLIAPGEFLPLAESSELIVELGAFALREAVLAAQGWEASASGVVPYVSVNVSAHQFRDPGLVEIVAAALAAAGLDPARLVIEVSERDALADVVTAVATIERLSDLGVGVALDNFGAGFASLSYLVRLHPRYVKIDHAFSRPAIDSLYNDALLESIVGLGAKLHLPILAEGIETSDQLGRLRRFGCEISQGFLFSPAVPASDVAAMIAELREAVASTRD
jgi:diguanylate cyclase (GGDEF)-like protein/PAS domain S-box-containing protein